MPFVQAKCTNCGATLEVDNTKDAAICPYCETPYVVEKAINNYNMTNNITAGTVNVFGGNSADFIIRGGVLEKYTGASLTPVIPNSVVEIGKSAFKDTRITSVTIPSSVTTIGEFAFSDCKNLTSVTIPNSVTKIDSWAFECSGLTSVTIPNSVSTIGNNAFYRCTGLTSVIIPDRPDSVLLIEKCAFSNCTGLTSVTISSAIIGSYAFGNCTNLSHLIINNASITLDSDYEDFSFSSCPIITIIAPEGWKRGYWKQFDCLKQYAPPPPPQPAPSGGCYIATAVYGSYDAPEVLVLRRYRDNVLQQHLLGRAFIRTYYFLSPPVAERLKNATHINRAVRRVLDRWVEKLSRTL